MLRHENVDFADDVVFVGNRHFVNCSFVRCTFVIQNGITRFDGCDFNSPIAFEIRWSISSPEELQGLLDHIPFMKTAFSSTPPAGAHHGKPVSTSSAITPRKKGNKKSPRKSRR